MTLWWIGNGILLLVVVPVLVALLNRVLAALERIRGAADDILAGGVALTGELDNVPEMLAETDGTIKDVSIGAVRYAGSVGKLLGCEGTIAMHAAALVTLIITGLIVAAAALGLFRVILHLKAIRQTLGTVIVGVQVVAHQTRTVPEVLPSVNANLKPVRDFCESI
jgi:hypothetical protein